MTKAEIIGDSISPKGHRITSFVLDFPRWILAEINTHRVFSRNAASSRAIPTEKIIQSIIDNPALPCHWGKNQSGMQAKEELDDIQRPPRSIDNEYLDILPIEFAQYIVGNCKLPNGKAATSYSLTDKEFALIGWLQARNDAVKHAKSLLKLGLHKQIANRILEPWFHMRIILTGTEFENFFALRAHPDAQPEFQDLAFKMLELYNGSTPKELKPGEWHIPFGDKMDAFKIREVAYKQAAKDLGAEDGDQIAIDNIEPVIENLKIKIAIARCARVSYLNFEGKDDYEADIKLCDRLFGSTPRHLSPTEHVAQCLDSDERIGNLIGWKQYRYTFKDQNLNDDRVLKS